MKIVENRANPEPPPLESITLTVSPEEMQMLREFASDAGRNRGSASRFLTLTSKYSLLPYNPGKCFNE